MFLYLILPSLISLAYVVYIVYALLACAWALAYSQCKFWTACLGHSLGLLEYLHVQDVKFVVPARLPHNVVEVSVLPEFRQAVGSKWHQQIILPEHIWTPLVQRPHCDTARGASPSPIYVVIEFEMLKPRARSPPAPVLVTGTGPWWYRATYALMAAASRIPLPPQRTPYCCFYRLQGMTDPFLFPPYPTPSKHIVHRAIHRASLMLQHSVDGRLSRQYACTVTDKINLVAGPRNDFFANSSVGYQLEETFLFLLLRSEIADLLDRAREYRLKSLPEVTTLANLDPAAQDGGRHSLSLKLRVHASPSKVLVVELDQYMPF